MILIYDVLVVVGIGWMLAWLLLTCGCMAGERVVWLVEKLLLLIVLIVQILRLSWGRLLIVAGE